MMCFFFLGSIGEKGFMGRPVSTSLKWYLYIENHILYRILHK